MERRVKRQVVEDEGVVAVAEVAAVVEAPGEL